MDRLIYKIEFFDYWHTGSGLSGSTYADSIVNKNDSNLPFIPGKTIKGLLREAATTINAFHNDLISSNFIDDVFGKENSVESSVFFTNVELSQKLSESIISNKLQNTLCEVIASTAIDENGQAKEGSLRQMEVTIPLTLYGVIENFSSKQEQEMLYCFAWVKQLGQNKNRGLGRCQISKIN